MAVYKVIQDVEAEDKLLGPLTLKGFIYAGIALTCGYINFRLLFIGSPVKWLFILMFTCPMLLFGVLASPLGREQPTEVWLLSRVRFFLKSRRRVWDQSGLEELVTVTAPKKSEVRLTKDLSPDEVQSRLKTLALMLDTRGWAIKNVDVNLSTPETEEQAAPASDRLVNHTGMSQQMPVVDVHAADDILDEKNNPTAKKFDDMMKRAEVERKQSILATLKDFVEDGGDEHHKSKTKKKHAKNHHSTKDLPSTRAALAAMKRDNATERARRQAEKEAAIEEQLAKARSRFSAEFEAGHKKATPAHQFLGLPRSAPKPVAQPPKPAPVTEKPQTDKMELAQSGSAFSVATLSKLANRPGMVEQTGPNEVTISLH